MGSAKTAAKVLFEELICKYGAPRELWSDRGKSFLGETVKYLTDLFQTKQKFTSGYHPQTNGLTERFNRTIIDELAKSVNADKDDWVELLPPKLFAYNTSVQSATGYTPFELLHSFMPRLPTDINLVEPPAAMHSKDWAHEIQQKAALMREDALRNQQAAALRQQSQYNKGLKPVDYEVGDLVRVYDPTAEGSKPVKFRNQWICPFRVAGKRGPLVELEDLMGTKQRGLFHPIKLVKVNEEMAHTGRNSAEI